MFHLWFCLILLDVKINLFSVSVSVSIIKPQPLFIIFFGGTNVGGGGGKCPGGGQISEYRPFNAFMHSPISMTVGLRTCHYSIH